MGVGVAFRSILKSMHSERVIPHAVRSSGVTSQQVAKLIIVVEDEVDIGTLIVQVIQEEMGHRALHYVTGIQALEVCRSQMPHLFILDYGLPDMTGLELHDRLHTFEHLSNVPTLLISVRQPPQRELRQHNINFLPKPFDLTRLQHTIAGLLA
jgi:CheY-like chemotaxis protein